MLWKAGFLASRLTSCTKESITQLWVIIHLQQSAVVAVENLLKLLAKKTPLEIQILSIWIPVCNFGMEIIVLGG